MHTQAAHREALRALARISLSLIAAGCVEDPSLRDPATADASWADAATDGAADDADALPDPIPDGAIFEDAAVRPDAGADAEALPDLPDALADAGLDMQAGDAMTEPCVRTDFSNDEAFWACCQENGFPPGACTPWGPPTPPRMRAVHA